MLASLSQRRREQRWQRYHRIKGAKEGHLTTHSRPVWEAWETVQITGVRGCEREAATIGTEEEANEAEDSKRASGVCTPPRKCKCVKHAKGSRGGESHATPGARDGLSDDSVREEGHAQGRGGGGCERDTEGNEGTRRHRRAGQEEDQTEPAGRTGRQETHLNRQSYEAIQRRRVCLGACLELVWKGGRLAMLPFDQDEFLVERKQGGGVWQIKRRG